MEKTVLEFREIEETPGAYTEVGNLVAVTPPGWSTEEVKGTVMQDDLQSFRPCLIPEEGQLKFRIEYNPNNESHAALHDLKDPPHTVEWRITWADGYAVPATDVFPGFLKEMTPTEGSVDGNNAQADLVVRVTDEIVRTPGAESES